MLAIFATGKRQARKPLRTFPCTHIHVLPRFSSGGTVCLKQVQQRQRCTRAKSFGRETKVRIEQTQAPMVASSSRSKTVTAQSEIPNSSSASAREPEPLQRKPLRLPCTVQEERLAQSMSRNGRPGFSLPKPNGLCLFCDTVCNHICGRSCSSPHPRGSQPESPWSSAIFARTCTGRAPRR